MLNKERLEEIRMKLWTKVAVAVAGALGCTDKIAPGKWADKVLEDFDKTFQNDSF